MRESCPYCGSTRARSGPARADYAYRVCGECGSGYHEQAATDLRAYYERYDPTLVLELPDILRRRYSDALAWIESLVTGRRLLEVGCGNGHFLEVAAHRGWSVKGIELSRAHVDRARSQGLDVVYGDLRDDVIPSDERFDVAVAIEVLEHLEHPRPFLDALGDRILPGGLVYITTPNFSSVTRRIVGERWSVLSHEHVALASPSGLRAALRAAGFETVHLKSKNLYLGEYRRAFLPRRDAPTVRLASENAALRDRIEESSVLRSAKSVANTLLGLTGLGESLECLARRGEA